MTSARELSSSKEDILQEFRVLCTKDLLDNQVDDTFLLRWLVAREFNTDKAYFMLKNYCEWKATNQIDKLLEWSPPEELKEACPYQIIPSDFEGRPVLIFPWGKWNSPIFTDKYYDVYQKYMDYMVNNVIKVMKPPATQFVIVGDSDGFTYGHMKYIKAIELNLEAVKLFDAHYPEYMHSAIVINCPKAFTLLFSLIKPFMSHRTRNKIRIFGCNKENWKGFIAGKIAQDQLPKNYRVDDDNDDNKSETIDEELN